MWPLAMAEYPLPVDVVGEVEVSIEFQSCLNGGEVIEGGFGPGGRSGARVLDDVATAVDHQGGAGNVGFCWYTEQRGGPDDFVGFGNASEWDLCAEPALVLPVLPKRLGESSTDDPWGDGVSADVVRSPFGGNVPHDGVRGGLGCSVLPAAGWLRWRPCWR